MTLAFTIFRQVKHIVRVSFFMFCTKHNINLTLPKELTKAILKTQRLEIFSTFSGISYHETE